MQRNLSASYDELLARRYGRPNEDGERGARTFEQLLGGYYGVSSGAQTKQASHSESMELTLSYDDGQGHVQPGRRLDEEYVVQRSLDSPDFEEYVVVTLPLPSQGTAERLRADQSGRDVSVDQEYQVDVRHPLDATVQRQPNAWPSVPAQQATPAGWSDSSEAASRAQVTESDFVADMQSILSGQSVFDPQSKKVVERTKQNTERDDLERLEKERSARADPAVTYGGTESNEGGLPAPDAKDGHDIFRRIAQSMTYANAYDLGTIELEKRFSSFDEAAEADAHAPRERVRNQSAAAPTRPTLDNTDFIQDLDAIHQQRAEMSAQTETTVGAGPTGG